MSEQSETKQRLSNGTWAVVTFIAVFVFGWLVYRQNLGMMEMGGIALIVIGVVILKLGKSAV